MVAAALLDGTITAIDVTVRIAPGPELLANPRRKAQWAVGQGQRDGVIETWVTINDDVGVAARAHDFAFGNR